MTALLQTYSRKKDMQWVNRFTAEKNVSEAQISS